MHRKVGILAGIVIFIVFWSPSALATTIGSFTDTNSADFLQGFAFNDIIINNENLSINFTNQPLNTTYANEGNFISRNFDIGKRVNWTFVRWAETTTNETQDVRIQVDYSENASTWVPGQEFNESGINHEINIASRYVRYLATLSTGNISFTPYLESITLNYTEFEVSSFLTGPADGSQSNTGNVDFECTGIDSDLQDLANVTFYWNYTGSWTANGTQALTGQLNQAIFQRTGLPDNTTFIWNCLVYNTNGDFAWAPSNYSVTVELTSTDTTKPVFEDYGMAPSVVGAGDNVTIRINASDNIQVHSTWINLTLPNGTWEIRDIANGGNINYTAPIIGRYDIVFYANDTNGNEVNTTGYFYANPIETFNVTFSTYDQSGINTNLTIKRVYDGSVVINTNSTTGNFTGLQLLGDIYDFTFSSFGGNIMVTLTGINISASLDSTVSLDRLVGVHSSYSYIYVVDTAYAFGDATIRIYYTMTYFDDESSLYVDRCSNWNLTQRACGGTWTSLSATKNISGDYFEFTTGSLSAFGITQGSFCGDGICDTSETSVTCPGDCQCVEGANQTCGTDTGACQTGTQTCVNAAWGTCQGSVGPSTEICNQIDDDCDGVVDNINNGTSINATQCGCYNGASPSNETCDNIDNNCDQLIDNSVTRECGINTGICEYGTAVCVNGVWGDTCVGDVGPQSENTLDVCTDGLDNDCDGLTDNEDTDCVTCEDGVQNGDEEGIDCGGSCPNGCFVFPLELFIILAAAIGIGVLVAFVLLKSRKKHGVTWESLESKYKNNNYW